MIEIKAFKCEFCPKLYQRKHFCKSHELSCDKNPKNKRACFDCKHLHKKDVDVYYDEYNGDESCRNVSLMFCSKVDSFLYPPKVEHKGNSFELGDYSNNPMPDQCDKREDLFNNDGSFNI